jgi:hypothetical protein
MRRYSIHVLATKGRFFSAGEPIPDDVKVPGCAERYRIREEEQRDKSHSSESADSDDETTERGR